MPAEPTMEQVVEAMRRAMAVSVARDDEGEFEPLMDLIGFSGENKTHTVLRQAVCDALAAAEALGFKLVTREPSEAMEDGEARDELLHDRMGGRHGQRRLPKAEVIARIWRAMWDAAPAVQQTREGA